MCFGVLGDVLSMCDESKGEGVGGQLQYRIVMLVNSIGYVRSLSS